MRTPAPTVALLRTIVVVLAASLLTQALSSADVDLDTLLAAHCEGREGIEIGESPIMSSFESSLEGSFESLLLESCRGRHRFRDAVWRVSSKLAVPAGAAEDFLRGSLLLEDEYIEPGEETAAYERIEKLFRRAWSQSPETSLLRDRLLIFYMERIDTEDAASRLVEMIQHDPDSGGLALHLTDGAAGHEESQEIVLAAALAKDPRRADLLAALGTVSSTHAFKAACYLGALNRVSHSEVSSDHDREASLAGNWLASLLEAGLAESALDAFGGLPARTRTAIVKGWASPLDEAFWLFPSEASPEVLLRSLCVAGVLEQPEVIENVGGVDSVRDRPAPLAADVCSGLSDDPYTARMVGPPGDDPFPLIQEIDLFAGMRNGRVARMVWLRGLIEWLEREEYPEATRDWYRMLLALLEADLRDTPHDLVLDLLPPDVRDGYDQIRQAVQDLRDAVKRRGEEIDGASSDGARAMVRLLAGPPADTPDVAALQISRSLERVRAFTPETTPVAPGSGHDDDPSEDLVAKKEMLRSLYHLPGTLWPCQVRQTDANVVATGWDICGDVGGPHGPRFVLVRSEDAGTTWSPPLDTGLRTITDQRVNCSAPLPPFSEGILPVELTPGVLVKLPLVILERDDDGDRLTDVLEERLMTDPASTDTDKDGLDDAEDPLPLIPLTPADEPSELESFLAELVPVLCDTGPSAFLEARRAREAWTRVPEGERSSLARTCGLVFERAAFRSMMPGKRLLVVTREEAERIRQKFGAFDPISFVTFFMDRGRHQAFLRWRQGWRERTALIGRSKGGWRVEPN